MANSIIFVANKTYALTNSRVEILRHFLLSGWRVIVAAAVDNDSYQLVEMGVIVDEIKFERGGLSIFGDIRAYCDILRIYQKWKPDIIHHFHSKPIILGTVAARWCLGGSVVIVNTVTGLGHAFIAGGLIRKFAGFGYNFSLRYSSMTIFQNRDDQSLFLENGWVTKGRSKLIIGSGVDIHKFSFIDREGRKEVALSIVMLGRLLKQKGVVEFAAVAANIREIFPDINFFWAGAEDLVHPDSVEASWFINHDDVEYLGELSDVNDLLQKADILLFPSYREGVPRVILEAASTGLPTIAFDVPGVREAVVDGETGFLVEYLNVDSLVDRLLCLINNNKKRLEIGINSRAYMKNNFDKRRIIQMYIDTYSDLGFEF